ncbi:ATP-binding protein [Insolitispirillum peregrinum]|uniref:hypothetical protein n=1 Tax=Insolitispirillum peregrinum TaxID=80876 RepID=UPI0036235752
MTLTPPKNKVYPGINPRALVSNLPKNEQIIVHTLATDFYITGGFNEITLNRSTYRYFFLKFPDEKAAAFGIKDEVIVLLSPFEKFEPRTLDAIEKIQEINPGFRLDKISAFVISNDKELIYKLNRIIKTQKESRLITPFTYEELSENRTTDYFRQRIKSFFFERNLYDFDSPLRKDLYFFGRDDLCQSLIDKYQTGQNSSLFGLRRSGKTSILLSVCRRISQQNGYATLIDCQILYQMPWNSALYYVASQINKEHKVKVLIDETRYTEDIAAMSFINDVEKINKKLKKCILIAFDEIEQITFNVSFSETWKSGASYVRFWHTIRGLSQRQYNPITILIAGTNPKCLEEHAVMGGDNPLFGQIKPEYIPGFNVSQTKQMIETLSSYMGISIEEDIYTYLVREFGGHPFLMRQACSHMKSNLPEGPNRHIDRLFYERSIETFYEGLGHSFCELVIGVLSEYYKDEYTMLSYLARGDVKDFEELAKSDPAYTQHLIGYGVICKSGDNYDFKIDTVKKHLSNKEKYKKINLSDSEKLSEISFRRNEIEEKLRKIVSQVLIALHGESEAKNMVLKKYDKNKKSKYSKLSYKELFNANKSEIYFKDLHDLIRNNWDIGFRNIFDDNLENFNSRMNILNSIGRSDAHKKNVSDYDMQIFRGAMTWLEEKVKEYLY